MQPTMMTPEAETTDQLGNDALFVDVQVVCCESGIPAKNDIRNWVRLAASNAGDLVGQTAEVVVRIVDVDEIRKLNREYRRQDAATNVLSFPSDTVAGLPEDVPRGLGDIVICAAVVRAEAVEQGKSLAEHWGHMLVHGTLHLFGFDHQDDVAASEMEGLEAKILANRGVADPYGAS